MKLQDALKIREENKDLIGRINGERMRIVDVFVAPIDSESFNQFISKYAIRLSINSRPWGNINSRMLICL